MLERLQKVLAKAGLGSRRECEKIITSGRVTVDGRRVTVLGTQVDPEKNRICCDGVSVKLQKKIYYLLHKPKGYLCTNRDELGRLRAIDILNNITQRIFTIGRLDKDSEGLVIVTNDGDLANRLSHPRYGISKTYRVEVDGYLTDETINAIKTGIWLSFGKTGYIKIQNVKRGKYRSRFEMVLREGKNREIRRILAECGYKVRVLRRIKIGKLSDPGLKVGKYRKLTDREIAMLYDMADKQDSYNRVRKKDRKKYDTASTG